MSEKRERWEGKVRWGKGKEEGRGSAVWESSRSGRGRRGGEKRRERREEGRRTGEARLVERADGAQDLLHARAEAAYPRRAVFLMAWSQRSASRCVEDATYPQGLLCVLHRVPRGRKIEEDW